MLINRTFPRSQINFLPFCLMNLLLLFMYFLCFLLLATLLKTHVNTQFQRVISLFLSKKTAKKFIYWKYFLSMTISFVKDYSLNKVKVYLWLILKSKCGKYEKRSNYILAYPVHIIWISLHSLSVPSPHIPCVPFLNFH